MSESFVISTEYNASSASEISNPSSYDIIASVSNALIAPNQTVSSPSLSAAALTSGLYRAYMIHIYNLDIPTSLGSYLSKSGSLSISASGACGVLIFSASRAANSTTGSITSDTSVYNKLLTASGIFLPIEFAPIKTSASYWMCYVYIDIIGVK